MTAAAAGIDRFGVVGFNHRQLPARLRGLLAFDDEWAGRLSAQLREAKVADGVAFVSTCNRQEIILSAQHPAFVLELVRAQLQARIIGASPGPLPEPYRYVGEEAVRHILRVSASLDSLVVGERQITQQLRRSFDRARLAGWMDKALNGLARFSVENAKAIHGRTTLGAQSVGVFTLARDLAMQETAAIEKPRISVIGLGEIGLRTARSLAADRRISLTLSSRRLRKEGELGQLLSTVPFVPMSELNALLRESDAIVLATGSSHPVIEEQLLREVRKDATKDLVLIDIGIPPQAGDVDGVGRTKLFNLDWFTVTGFGQHPQAREALKQAEEIVEEGVRGVTEWMNVRRYSSLFDTCVTLTDDFKSRVIPDLMKAELGMLAPEHQRLVHSSMYRLMTAYSEGLFEALNRELSEKREGHGTEPIDHR